MIKKYEKKTYIDYEIDIFLKEYGDKNVNISYNKNKNKFDTEEITKSLKKLRNELINFSEFDEEYGKFMSNLKAFKDYKKDNFSSNQKK